MAEQSGWTVVPETAPAAPAAAGWTPVAEPTFKTQNEPPSAAMRFASELYNKSPLPAIVAGAEGIGNTIAHPLDTYFGLKPVADTVKNLAKAQWDQAIKAAQKARETTSGGGMLSASEALGHGLAAILPILGPAAADVGEHGAKGDIAGMVGGATGLLAPFAAKYGLELKNAPDPRGADLLRREAEQTVSQRVLAPGNQKYKGTAQMIAPEVLDRKLQGNRLQLQQMADEGMASAGDKIDAAVQSNTNPVAVTPIVSALDSRIADMQDAKGRTIPTAVGRVAQLEKLRDYVKDMGPDASFEELRKVRDEFYQAADAAKGYQGPDINVPDVGWAAREAGSAIRQQFAADRPELVGPNADFTFFKRLGDVLDPTIGRPKNVSYAPTGVTGGLSTAGAIIGQAFSNVPVLKGASALIASRILPALKEAQNSPAWQLTTAAKKMEIADAIEKGQLGKAQGLLLMIAIRSPRNSTAGDVSR